MSPRSTFHKTDATTGANQRLSLCFCPLLTTNTLKTVRNTQNEQYSNIINPNITTLAEREAKGDKRKKCKKPKKPQIKHNQASKPQSNS